GSRYALARYIGDHQAEPSLAEIQKIVIIAADGASGVANANIGEGFKRRMPLWQEARLYLLGDCQVVSGLALCLQLCRLRTALLLKSARGIVDLNKRETVPVHIFEKGEPRLPCGQRIKRLGSKT